MKSGICPKCNSKEIYGDLNHPHGIQVQKFAFTPVNTILLVCANCGYLEFYVENDSDLEKIKKKFRKVEN